MSDAAVTFGTLDYGKGDAPAPGSEARFSFACPRRKGDRCSGLLIAGRSGLKRDGQGQNGGHAMWDWDGKLEAPTFNPSINCGVCGWHGYIVAGRCVTQQKTEEPEP